MQRTVFNKAQLDLLRMMSFVRNEDSLDELRQVIVDYFAQKAKREMDAMWASGEMNEQKLESFKTLHQRTPYSKVHHAEYRS